MALFLSVLITLLCRVSALKEVGEFAAAVPASVKFATDVQGLAEKVQHTAQVMQHFHDKSQDPQKQFTWVEVATFNGKNGVRLYIVIDNKVYDITEYAVYHPPGPEPLQDHAGQDATTAVKIMNPQLFEPFLHFFQVGTIIDSQMDNSTALQSAVKNSIEPRLS